MDWGYLDELDCNLLYTYAKGFAKCSGRFCMEKIHISDEEEKSEQEQLTSAERKRQTALYIIWCVFRHVLGCRTLEEAEASATEEVLRKYKLVSLLKNRHIYIGVYGDNEIYLYKYDEGDINVILEILYNRYDMMAQMECFVRRTEGKQRTTRNRCLKKMKE